MHYNVFMKVLTRIQTVNQMAKYAPNPIVYSSLYCEIFFKGIPYIREKVNMEIRYSEMPTTAPSTSRPRTPQTMPKEIPRNSRTQYIVSDGIALIDMLTLLTAFLPSNLARPMD